MSAALAILGPALVVRHPPTVSCPLGNIDHPQCDLARRCGRGHLRVKIYRILRPHPSNRWRSNRWGILVLAMSPRVTLEKKGYCVFASIAIAIARSFRNPSRRRGLAARPACRQYQQPNKQRDVSHKSITSIAIEPFSSLKSPVHYERLPK